MKKNKRNTILLCAVILGIFVRATFIALVERLGLFMQDAEGAISLTDGKQLSFEYNTPDNGHNNTDIQQNLVVSDTGSVIGVVYGFDGEILPLSAVPVPGVHSRPLTTMEYTTAPTVKNMYNPGYEASDDTQVWTTSTKVDIFKVTYANGGSEITVRSDNGDKVFAPGTDNSYTFKFKNTGDVSLRYTMDIKAYFTPADLDLPIDGRINRYDGKWLTEGEGAYLDVLALDGIHDEDTLGAGKYTYYTLDWRWPFERGADDIDTAFGNRAVNEDLTLTIEIITTATATEEPGGGIILPDTGDDTNTILWLCLTFGSGLLIVLLLYYRKCMDEENESEV